MSTIAAVWQASWEVRAFRWRTLATALVLPLALASLATFLNRVELRPGAVLPDPILRLYAARDVTWITFTLIYGGILSGLALLTRTPDRLLAALQAYAVMVAMRIVVMYLTPLDPPEGALTLTDPFVEYFGTGQTLTRDLFFSGHTSTLFLLVLTMPTARIRIPYLVCTIAVACCVLLQHVHYSVDVAAAPVFAYAAYRFVVLTVWSGRLSRAAQL